eukprot:4735049-Pleurochrysis_carterae.AAC.1
MPQLLLSHLGSTCPSELYTKCALTTAAFPVSAPVHAPTLAFAYLRVRRCVPASRSPSKSSINSPHQSLQTSSHCASGCSTCLSFSTALALCAASQPPVAYGARA